MNAALPVLGVSVVVAGASFAGQAVLALAVVVCQALLASGWHQLLGAPAQWAGPAVVFGAGVSAVACALISRDEPTIAPMVTVLALALVAAFAGELWRYDGGPGNVVHTLSVTVAGSVLSVLGAGLVAERGATLGLPVTVASVLAAGFAAALAYSALPPGALGVAGAVGVGVATGLLGSDLGLLRAVFVCLLAGSFGLIARRIAAGDLTPAPVTVAATEAGAPAGPGFGGRGTARAARRRAERASRRQGEAATLVGAALPVLVAAPGTYVLGRLLVG